MTTPEQFCYYFQKWKLISLFLVCLDSNEKTINMDLIRQGMVFLRNVDRDGKRLLIFKSKLYIRGANNMTDMKTNLLYFIERLYRWAIN